MVSLICDDDYAWRRIMTCALAGEVLQAASIGEALTLAKNAKPNVLVLDAFLPDGIGWSAIPLFRDASPDTEIVVMTAHANRTDALRSVGEHRAFAYLDKCEALETIQRTVRMAFAASVTAAVKRHVERLRHAVRAGAIARRWN